MIKRLVMLSVGLSLTVSVALGDVWQDLAKYEYGDPSDAGAKAEAALQATPVAEHGPIEEALIRVVSDANATVTGKALACRMLQQVGTPKCVPAVAGLLGHERLSHYARLVLERLPDATAGEALRKALARVPETLKTGIVDSLGERRDTAAVAQIAALARSTDPTVAQAATRTLGKIGGEDAAAKLVALPGNGALKPVRLDAMIVCGERTGGATAVSLYDKVWASDSPVPRIGALRGMIRAGEQKASGLVIASIRGDDIFLRRSALRLVAEEPSEAVTKTVAGALAELPPDLEVAVLEVLGQRGDRAAMAGIMPCLNSKTGPVQDAAIYAAGKLGGAESLKALLTLAAGGPAADKAAAAIARMAGDDVDATLIGLLVSPQLRAPAVNALTARGCRTAGPELLKLIADKDPVVRKGAWAGLASLGSESDMGALMKALVAVSGGAGEKRAAQAAVRAVCARAMDKGKCFDMAAACYEQADQPVRELILELGATAGTANALALEKKVLDSGDQALHDKALHDKALRALAAWSNAGAADDLLRLATEAKTDVDRIVALRGYIRIAGLDSIRLSGQQRTKMFRQAAALAKRPDEQQLIISGLRQAPTPGALEILAGYMDNPALKGAAELSAADLVWDLRTSNAEAVSAMIERLSKSDNKAVAEKARKCVADTNKSKAYVRDWLGAGPYSEKGKDGAAIFAVAFPPEKPDAKGVHWRKLTKGIGPDVIDLEKAIARGDRCAAYVKTTLSVPAEQQVRLGLGSDDGIKAWLNGELIHKNWVTRGCTPGQDVVKATLKKGRNELMLEIIDESSFWAFSCRVLTAGGKPVDGLKVQAE